jgi:small subunit ribosomal protein S18
MARNNDRDRGTKRTIKDTRPRGKKKVCIFCKDRANWVDYKDVNLLRRFMSDRGKIRARRVTGNCAQHQRDVQVAIKTARELALLPYTQRTVNERGPGRAPGRGGVRREDSATADLVGDGDLEVEDLDMEDDEHEGEGEDDLALPVDGLDDRGRVEA